MSAEGTETLNRAALLDAYAGVPDLLKDALTSSVAKEDRNGAYRTGSQLEDLLQGLVNRGTDEKLRSIEFEVCLLCRILDVTMSPREFMTIKSPC